MKTKELCIQNLSPDRSDGLSDSDALYVIKNMWTWFLKNMKIMTLGAVSPFAPR